MLITATCIALLSFIGGGDEDRPEFAKYFASQGVQGCFVLYDEASDRSIRYNAPRCAERFPPASTFKIPNTLIGLETGVLLDTSTTFRWDGVERSIDEWNRDHNLQSAFRYSVVWYYQEVARRVGETRMRQWVDTLGYGNRDTGGGIDMFWLSGSLRISCDEQIDFLRRLHGGRLPVSARSAGILRQVMRHEQSGEAVMYAKTGWALRGAFNVGWLVGWIERGENTWYFAMNLTAPEGDERVPAKRVAITRAILGELGVWE